MRNSVLQNSVLRNYATFGVTKFRIILTLLTAGFYNRMGESEMAQFKGTVYEMF
jgi:hypothetical protein